MKAPKKMHIIIGQDHLGYDYFHIPECSRRDAEIMAREVNGRLVHARWMQSHTDTDDRRPR